MGDSMKIRNLSAVGLAFLVSCSSDPKPEVNPEDAVNDALISFTYNAQAGRYSEALEQITYEDQIKILDGNGNVKPEYQAAFKRIKISALQKMHFVLDDKGRLEGMIAVLDEANTSFTMSQEQRSTNLDKVEKNRKTAPANEASTSGAVASSAAPDTTVTDNTATEKLETPAPATPEPASDSALTIDEYLK